MNKYPEFSRPLADPIGSPGGNQASGCSSLTAIDNGHTRPTSIVAWLLISLVYMYRYSLGHWFTGSCRFYPSCSHYSEEAFRRHGACRGSMMTLKRLMRCHPWSPGGFDQVD